MMARSSTASFEKVKRIGACIMGGARGKSIRTLMCHSPFFSVTSVVLIEKLPAPASATERLRKAAANAQNATAKRTDCSRAEAGDGRGAGQGAELDRRIEEIMTGARYYGSVGRGQGIVTRRLFPYWRG